MILVSLFYPLLLLTLISRLLSVPPLSDSLLHTP